MNAALPLVSDHFVSKQFASNPFIYEYFMPEEEIDAQLKEFADHCERLDRPLTEAQEIANFASFFSSIRAALKTVGSFDEGGFEEADFSSPHDADPSRILTVTSAVPITRKIADSVLAACVAMGSDYAVVFEGITGRCVLFSNGDFLHEE